MTLTLEQIEDWREFIPRVMHMSPNRTTELNSLCDLAKRGLVTMPRPISEAPKDGTPIFTDCTFGGNHYNMIWVDEDDGAQWIWDDEILADNNPDCAQPTTFILQSALDFKP